MMETLTELAQEAVYEMRHLSTDTEHGLAQDLQRALDNLHQTVTLPITDYETQPVTPHPLDTLAQVATFMRTAGQEVKAGPGIPPPEVLALRLSLELEELAEKAVAFGLISTFATLLTSKLEDFGCELGYEFCYNGIKDTLIYDAVEVLDAAVDQRYVQDGTVLACGLQEAFPESFANVQASNMSKFCTSIAQANATIRHYADKNIYTSLIRPDNTYWVIKRLEDGKILKSVGYIPASLGPILEKYSGQ